jgi:WD40 repeat protein
MIDFGMYRRFRWTSLSALVFCALSACSSSSEQDKQPLVLISAPLGAFAPQASWVDISVIVANVPTPRRIAADRYGDGKIGVYLPAGTSGDATVVVTVSDASSCAIAIGASAAPVKVKPGETTPVVSITLTASPTPCGPSDGGAPASDDGSVGPETSGLEVAPPDTRRIENEVGVGVEVGVAVESGSSLPDSGADVVAPIEARPEVGSEPDLAPDSPVGSPDLLTSDQALDRATDALPVGPDLAVGPDLGPDALVTTANVFTHCSTYSHVRTGGSDSNLIMSRVIFSPDKKNLITCGNDGRAKVWDITPTGLATPSSDLQFIGTDWLWPEMSADGKLVAVGDADGNVKVYDWPMSIQNGAAAEVANFPWKSVPRIPGKARPLGFTTDGNHLVVRYINYELTDPTFVIVWDLSSQKVARQIDMHNKDDWAMAAFPGDFATSVWIATDETVYDDAGYRSVVTLLDIAKTPISTVQFSIPDNEVYAVTFSPDGNTLAIGFADGQLDLWDISNKGAISRLGASLLPGGSGNWINSIVFSADGKYVGTGLGGMSPPYSVKLISTAIPRTTLTKSLEMDGMSVAISRDGLALAVTEYSHGTILYCTP